MNTETIQECVADIGREADRLNRLSQKLLTLSRTDNQLDREHTIIKIAPTVERVVRMLSEIANDNKITIETNLKDDSNILILEDDLYQILFNLIENGIKYNTQNGVLSISLKQQDKNAIICIQDTGVGIPPDSIDHIFERFYRVDKARSRSTGGSGLGLSIVRSIVDRNNGTIRVISDLGIGTAFTLSFPVFDAQEVI